MNKHKSFTVDEALSRLQRYCSYQERCHQEVHRKLKEMRMIPEAIDHIIVSLINDGYLNEERFAQNFVRGKFRIKKWGKNRMRLELMKREVGKVNIKRAFNEINEDEYLKVFHELAKSRFNSLKEPNKLKKKKKLADYLLYRGWESHLVYDKVNELIK